MANRYYDRESERYGRRSYDDYEAGRGYGRGREERGFFDRAGDEVRSWFGDEDAERRRRYDEERYGRGYTGSDFDRINSRTGYGREREYGRGDYGSEYGTDLDRFRGYGRGSSYGTGYSSGTGYGNRGYEGERFSSYGTRGEEGRFYGGYEGQGYGGYGGYGGSETGYGTRSYEGQDYGYDKRGYDWGQGGYYSSTPTEPWRSRGQHSGRGPQGYKRSDQRIEEDVNERLTQHGQVDASLIQVSVKDGEVTLSGSVNSRLEKRLAEDLAEDCSGVKQVHNQLRVQQQAQGQSLQSGTTSATETQPQRRSAAR